MLVAKEKVLPSNRCYAVKICTMELNVKMFVVLFWTSVKSFMLLSPIFAPIALTVGKFYDVLAAMLNFNFS